MYKLEPFYDKFKESDDKTPEATTNKPLEVKVGIRNSVLGDDYDEAARFVRRMPGENSWELIKKYHDIGMRHVIPVPGEGGTLGEC